MSGDDSDVLARAKRGDQSAFTELLRRYQKRVFSTALHLTGNRHDADDVTQDTFIRAYRGLATFDGRADFFTWLYRITINTGLNHLRSKKRAATIARAGAAEVEKEGGRPEKFGVRERTPAEWATINEHYQRVLGAISELSPTLRITLVLATVEGLSYREIAEILEIPEGTVAWRVNEARKQLRARLADDSGQG